MNNIIVSHEGLKINHNSFRPFQTQTHILLFLTLETWYFIYFIKKRKKTIIIQTGIKPQGDTLDVFSLFLSSLILLDTCKIKINPLSLSRPFVLFSSFPCPFFVLLSFSCPFLIVRLKSYYLSFKSKMDIPTCNSIFE